MARCGSNVAITEFFARRWRGEVPLATLFWRDMIVVGSLVNALATLSALIAATQGVALGVAAAMHFAPVPYNVFLFTAVGRSPQRTPLVMGVAGVWFVLALAV